jgi:hypothetical protein
MSYIFISYSHRDSDYAYDLADSIDNRGLEAWIDERIDYGTQWPLVIQKQIDGCGAFIVIMTPRSFESKWVQNELSYAQAQGKPIFPLLLEGSVWVSVAATQCVDVRNYGLPPKRFYKRLEKVAFRSSSYKETPAVRPTTQHYGGIERDLIDALRNLGNGDSLDIMAEDIGALALVAKGKKSKYDVQFSSLDERLGRKVMNSREYIENLGWFVEGGDGRYTYVFTGVRRTIKDDSSLQTFAREIIAIFTRVLGASIDDIHILEL